MRLQFIQIDFNYLIIIFFRISINFIISTKVMSYLICFSNYLSTICGLKISSHILIISKYRVGCANLSTHITNGSFSCCRKRICTFAKVLNDSTRSTFYSKDTRHFQDNIFSCSPCVQFTCKFNTNKLWKFQFPSHTCHYIHSISSTNTYSNHS